MRVFFLLFVAWIWPGLAHAALQLGDTRIWDAPDHTRIVFDANGSVRYHIFRLSSPERVVIDISGARLGKGKRRKPAAGSLIRRVRYGHPRDGVLRVVLDMRQRVRAHASLLAPTASKPFRLVIDLWPERKKNTSTHASSSQARQEVARAPTKSRRKRQMVVAVDAGHGGEDPGAIGPHGLREKDVTLKVAKALAALINRQPGMRAVLIRKGDYFVPLKKRVALVRKANADLMISLHADSVSETWVKGSSVYTISERGATEDKVAAALAARENASDLIGGVVSDHQIYDAMTRNVLGDMARQDAFNSSQLLAEQVLREIKAVSVLKYRRPKRARFVVLGALEVPSVLVELDYISNPRRERKLRSSAYQQTMARALMRAVRSFLRRMSRHEGGSTFMPVS